jgi:hypothetical protein
VTIKRWQKGEHDDPAIVECISCGHRATTRSRGFPALSIDDLAGKVVTCSKSGKRQRVSRANLIESTYARTP